MIVAKAQGAVFFKSELFLHLATFKHTTREMKNWLIVTVRYFKFDLQGVLRIFLFPELDDYGIFSLFEDEQICDVWRALGTHG